MNLQLAQACPEDLPEICRIENLSFTDPWPREDLAQGMDDPEFAYLVVRTDTGLAAYGLLLVIPGVEAQVYNIAVDPAFRRMGLAETLMDCFLQIAKDLEAKEVTLEVRPSNEAAIGLYQKLGFQKIGMRSCYYPNGEDAIVMQYLHRS